MKKVIDFLFIFSKLITSFVMLLIIILLGYLLYNSYKNIDNTSLELDSKLSILTNSINTNDKNIKTIIQESKNFNKKLIKTEELLNNSVLNSNKNYDNEIINIIKMIEKVEIKMEYLISKLNNENLVSDKNTNEIIEDNSDKLSSYLDLIWIKFKNGKKYKEEIFELEKLLPNNKKFFIEKLLLYDINFFYGLSYLEIEFNKSISTYTNEKFLSDNKNSVINFLSNFVNIRPRNLSKYQNEELNILMRAKKLMQEEKILDSLNQILLIEDNKKFFSLWINQANIYLDFKSTIEKIS